MTLILLSIIFLLAFLLCSPNYVYLIHKDHFMWRQEPESNFALIVLKEAYSKGDSYHCGENDLVWWAFFSNDKPLQQGEGWSLTINKRDFSFSVDKEGEAYKDRIEKIIKWNKEL